MIKQKNYLLTKNDFITKPSQMTIDKLNKKLEKFILIFDLSIVNMGTFNGGTLWEKIQAGYKIFIFRFDYKIIVLKKE